MNVMDVAIAPRLPQEAIPLQIVEPREQATQDLPTISIDHGNQTRPFLRQLAPGRFFKVIDNIKADQCFEPAMDYNPTSLQSSYDPTFGTYMVHGELLLDVAEFNDTPYAKAKPWQDTYNSNWNIELKPVAHYRSFFNQGTRGNYLNFYEMLPISEASSFYANSKTPQFYSSDGNCTETTISPDLKNRIYEQYKPFFVENRGYSRAYFYGMAR